METDILGPPLRSVRALELDGNISLYDSSTDQALVLNVTASDVWRLLDGQHDFAGILDTLAAKYGAAAVLIRDDVAAAIRALTPFLVRSVQTEPA